MLTLFGNYILPLLLTVISLDEWGPFVARLSMGGNSACDSLHVRAYIFVCVCVFDARVCL
jgi:hypothetical protein